MPEGLCVKGWEEGREIYRERIWKGGPLMICALIRNLMDFYVTGRLAPLQARIVKRHIETCPRCVAEARAWESTFKALRGFSVPPPRPAALQAAVKAAVAAAASGEDSFSGEIPEAPREDSPSMVLAFSLLTFLVTVSVSIFGPGLPSQSCTNNDSSVCRPDPGKPSPTAKL